MIIFAFVPQLSKLQTEKLHSQLPKLKTENSKLQGRYYVENIKTLRMFYTVIFHIFAQKFHTIWQQCYR